ncbi:AsmA family protein [Rhodobacteraceae bacterium NNCM2]|nr:AsmA family protein [Coraliihabitans acroporae]
MSLTRLVRWAFHACWSLALGLLVCAVLLFFSIGHIDWSFLKSRFETAASEHLGGKLVLEGQLSFSLFPSASFEVSGFRIEGLGDGNAPGTVSAGRTSGNIALLPLLGGEVDVVDLEIADLTIDAPLPVAGGDKGEAAQGGEPRGKSVSAISVRNAEIGIAQAVIRDTETGEVHTVKNGKISFAFGFSGLSQEEISESLTGSLALQAASFTSRGDGDVDISGFSGLFKRDEGGAPIASTVKMKLAAGLITAPTAMAFKGHVSRPVDLIRGKPMKIRGAGTLGDLAVELNGHLQSTGGRTSVDFQTKARADGTAFVDSLAGEALPVKGSTVEGRVIYRRSHYELSDFSGVFDGISAQGSLTVTTGRKRPMLEGDLALDKITLPPSDIPAHPGRIIPPLDIRIEGLDKADARLKLSVESLEINPKTTLADLSARVELDNGVLSADHAKARLDDGEVTLKLRVDSRTTPQKVYIDASATGIRGDRFIQNSREIVAGDARSDLSISVAGTGDNLQAFAATVSGSARTDVQGGKFLLNRMTKMVAGAHSIFTPLIQGKELSSLHCASIRWSVSKGIATSQGLIVDTSEFAIGGLGTINLRDEKLDLEMAVHPVEERLLQFSTAFHLGGTLAAPVASPEATSAVTGIINVAGATVNPLGAMFWIQKSEKSGSSACRNALDTSGKVTETPKGLVGAIAAPVVKGTVGTATKVITGTGKAVGNVIEGIGEGIGKGIGSIFGGGDKDED